VSIFTVKNPDTQTKSRLTVLPEFVFLLSPLRETLDALLQGLEQNGLRDLESRVVRLPELEVDLREHVARHRGVTVKEID
jgi:hypothetical protein